MTVKIKADKYQEIIELYNIGEPLHVIGNRFSVCRETIAKILRKCGISITNRYVRQASFGADLDFFSNHTEGAAYFYGFLLADGCLDERERVRVEIQRGDAHILEDLVIAAKLNSEVVPTEKNRGRLYSKLVFKVPDINKSLKEKGFTQRKSLKEKVPEEYELDRHFWRGMVDGDGCITMSAGMSPRIYLCGGIEVCTKFRNYCMTLGHRKTYPEVLVSKGDLYRVTFNGKFAALICKELYADCTFRLDRKYKKASELICKLGGKLD